MTTLSTAAARQKLASLRTTDSQTPLTYPPSEIHALGTHLLTLSLPDPEHYALLEQTFTAALDTGNIPSAESLLQKISTRFPFDTSIRTQRLYGLLNEATGNFDKAAEIYETALKQDESNIAILKRLVAILVERGQRHEAIIRLKTYADTFMQDTECWSQLASLYLSENMYEQAAFCYEELLMLKPQNHLYYIRYADLVATLGRWEVAVKYYCAALELTADNVRALYGLRAATAAVLGDGGVEGSKAKGVKSAAVVEAKTAPSVETLHALHKLAGDRLTALFEGQGKDGAELTTVVKSWLQAN
ncbi:ER membrane complex subunit 2 [Rhizophlyctis rosea]|uniref:ER membrane protein complex subunit 2 n=1 Tax=Rhizophlyctis rosea TaxID=64517 RepID=A0AAD5X3E3_9FUNG|nr:ER membrane complex subunit 2 [Rhizophlyctis rosea]